MQQEANKYKFRRYMKNKEAQTQSLEINRWGTSS